LASETSHGNARYFQKLRESLSIHALLRAWASYKRPLHSSSWNRIFCVIHGAKRVASVRLVVVVVVGVQLRLSCCACSAEEPAPGDVKQTVNSRYSRFCGGGMAAQRDHGGGNMSFEGEEGGTVPETQ